MTVNKRRVSITIDSPVLEIVERLATTGLYGSRISDVVRTLMFDAIKSSSIALDVIRKRDTQ